MRAARSTPARARATTLGIVEEVHGDGGSLGGTVLDAPVLGRS